jgi:hypothetical protein
MVNPDRTIITVFFIRKSKEELEEIKEEYTKKTSR